ncbi:MAG: hypothetical protein LQ346_008492 [Caloplaca aetnensis]|nr:MAG: hypothetical protein LQ346_008492 [Caloplaca aetnensis]
MLYVIPPEWQLLYLGSSESLSIVQRNPAIQHHQTDGKLELRLAPRNESYGGREQRNRLLTDAAFYKEYLPAAEWLFMYHTDSILCANSPLDLNDWLKYDWVGAPWYNYDRWSGGGGLSLRRVSRIKQVLSFQTRQDDADSEDKWLSDRIKVLPGIKLPKPEVEKSFAVEGTWHEKPMGFHLPSSTDHLLKEAWDDPEHRKKAFEYCPEVKMIMNMKLERERCEEKPKEETPPTKEQIEKEMKEHLEKEMKEQAEKKAAMIIEEEKKHAKSENGKGAEASSAPRGDATLVLYTTVIAAAV